MGLTMDPRLRGNDGEIEVVVRSASPQASVTGTLKCVETPIGLPGDRTGKFMFFLGSSIGLIFTKQIPEIPIRKCKFCTAATTLTVKINELQEENKMSAVSTMSHVLADAVRTAGHVTHDFFEHLGDSLTRSASQIEHEREEAYLAEAVDLADLECRMHELDHARQHHAFWAD